MACEFANGRLAQLTHTAGATPLADFGYGYNGVGNVTQIAELTQTRNFAYDDLQRLTAGGTAAAPESYAYDPEGNRTASHLSASHTTDTANRLSEDDSFCYAYDLNGNLANKTAKVAGICTGAVTSYTYDAQDQLIRIDFPDLTFAAYRYDGSGRRTEKDVNGSVTRYVYDFSAILLEYDGAASLLARYSHGQRVDQPLAVARDLDSSGAFEAGEQFYYQADHQGSLRKVTDAAGQLVNSYDYDAYGNIEASVEGIVNPFTYTGREFDAESGLYFYRARYYDPATGRFLSEDPIGFGGGDVNLYRYVFNNPANFTDPSGLQPQALCLLTGPGAPVTCTAAAAATAVVALCAWILGDILVDQVLKSESNEGNDQDKKHSPDREALNDLIDEATSGGREPWTDSEADTILDWADELGVEGVRDNRGEDHWGGRDHIHIPDYGGKTHIPTKPD